MNWRKKDGQYHSDRGRSFTQKNFLSTQEAMQREKPLKSAAGRDFIKTNIIPKWLSSRSYPPVGGRRFEPSLRNKEFKARWSLFIIYLTFSDFPQLNYL
jgi:hypothetical protein